MMEKAQIDEVWTMLDQQLLREIANRGPRPLFATISGAHLYGFASPDSDVDLRGAFLHSAEDMLGLFPPNETLTIEDKSQIDLDWVAHDIRKFARLLTNHNGYVLEQVFSPLVVIGGSPFEELRELSKGCITRPTIRHYLGFARGRRKRLLDPEPTVKHLLYAYRVLLTGIHLMRSGVLNANILSLNSEFQLPEVDDLVARKREGFEKMPLSSTEVETFIPKLDALETDLHSAHESSTLPLECTNKDALNDFVVRLRLHDFRNE